MLSATFFFFAWLPFLFTFDRRKYTVISLGDGIWRVKKIYNLLIIKKACIITMYYMLAWVRCIYIHTSRVYDIYDDCFL